MASTYRCVPDQRCTASGTRPESRLRITKRIRRAVSALESHLVRQPSLRPFDKEFRIEGNPAVRIGVELDHPAVESTLVELRIDCAIERVGEIDAPTVAAH